MARIHQTHHNLLWCSIELPAYAICGKVNGSLFYCVDFKLRTDCFYNIIVRTPKSKYFDNTTTKYFPEIRKALAEFMHSEKFNRVKPFFEKSKTPKPLYGAPSSNVSTKEFAPFVSRPRHEDISWEENAYQKGDIGYKGFANVYEERAYVGEREEYITYNDNGSMSVSYDYEPIRERRAIAHNDFDGYDKHDDSWHRDGMKVNQTKLRPQTTSLHTYSGTAQGDDNRTYAEKLAVMSDTRLNYELHNCKDKTAVRDEIHKRMNQ